MRHSYDTTMPIASADGTVIAEIDVRIDYTTAADGTVEVQDVTAYGWQDRKMVAAPLPDWLDGRVCAWAETLERELLEHANDDWQAAVDEYGDWLRDQREARALEAMH